MDLATIIGIVLSFGLVIGAIVMGGSPLVYLSAPAALIVIGGTIGATLVYYPLKNVLGIVGIIKNTLIPKTEDPSAIIDKFLEFANKARREGILSLEPALKEVEDQFLRKGLQLTVDGLEPETIKEILENDISYLEDRHSYGAEILETMGAVAPAMGMIGTVIGLIQMLNSMEDPSTIGPAMAVALIRKAK